MNNYDLNTLAEEAGLIVYDTALPQHWVDAIVEHTKEITGTSKGIYPYGFVWCYDKSEIFGEPVPLTDGAKMFAQFLLINPRVYEGIDWKVG